MAYHFKNLVFEGGGVQGIAYCGALEVLEEKGILANITRMGGASAGAIMALLLGLGYTKDEILSILWGLNFRNFMDDSWGIIRDTKRLLTSFGWYKGDYFREWVAKIIGDKTGNPNATFNDIANMKGKGFRAMYFIATNLSTGFSEVFSNEHTPRMCVADAVRMSMAIPLFFAAKRSARGDVYVDGGLLDNYPVRLFDREKYVECHYTIPTYYKNHNAALKKERKTISKYVYNQETLGFRLDSDKEIAVFRDQAEPMVYPIDSFFDYAWRIANTIYHAQQSQHLNSEDWQRTIYIDTMGVDFLDFGLGDDKKKALVQSGSKHAKLYFAWFDDPANAPENRVKPSAEDEVAVTR